MKNGWKALAALTVATALVIAPLAATGAVADEEVLPPVEVVEVVAPVEEAVAPVEEVAVPAEVVAVPAEEAVVAVPAEEAPAAAVVESEPAPQVQAQSQPDMICTESGEGWQSKVDTSGDPATVTVTAPEGFLIDAYCVKAGTTSVIVNVTPSATVVIDHPDKDSVSHYQVHLIPIPDVEILPPTVEIAIDCEAESEVEVTATNPNNEDVDVTLYLDFNGDNVPDASEVLTVVPGETVLHYNFTEDVTVGVTVVFDEAIIFDEDITVDCDTTTVVPVPALFSAEPEPPTCLSAGSFDFSVDQTPNLVVTVTPEYDGPGTYVVTATAINGATFPDGTTVKTRTIVVAEQLSGPELCPLAGETITLGAPTSVDACGTANDGASLPPAQEGVEYVWEDESDDDNFNVLAIVEDGYVVSEASAGWAPGEGENVFVYAFNPTFSNAPCTTGGGTPPPSGTPAKTSTPGSLAVTGAPDMTTWGIGAVAAMLAGMSLLGFRRFVRR